MYKRQVLLYLASFNSFAGCESPFGTYSPKEGTTSITINIDQSLDIKKITSNESTVIYSGRFTNFDEMIGTEYLNYVNAIDVKPLNEEQSHICLHIAGNCSHMKVGVCRRTLELFGGKPPTLDARIYWKND